MANQDKHYTLSKPQMDILDLEKKYFSTIKRIIKSEQFIDDLKKIENEIKLDYSTLSKTWNIKNKIKVAAERLVRHHIYINLISEIKGVYESPISPDIGLVMEDCIFCIDCKTIDTEGNATDIRYTTIEPNQTSFDNSNHKYIPSKSNLVTRSRLDRIPVLTYILKIIYTDDGAHFDIPSKKQGSRYPSLVLTCIPNGELSELFDKDLIFNFKTYKYFSEKDGLQYKQIEVPKNADRKAWVKSYCTSKGWAECKIPMARGEKIIYFDIANNCSWIDRKDKTQTVIAAIKYGDNMRLNNNYLKERYDSASNPWLGYEEFSI